MGFFDFLKKFCIAKADGQTWKGDTKNRPLDDLDQQQKMADLDRKTDEMKDRNDSMDSNSYGE